MFVFALLLLGNSSIYMIHIAAYIYCICIQCIYLCMHYNEYWIHFDWIQLNAYNLSIYNSTEFEWCSVLYIYSIVILCIILNQYRQLPVTVFLYRISIHYVIYTMHISDAILLYLILPQRCAHWHSVKSITPKILTSHSETKWYS